MRASSPSPAAVDQFPHRHLLGIEGLIENQITYLLERADSYVAQNRKVDKRLALLRGRTQINLFYEASTRTRTSPGPSCGRTKSRYWNDWPSVEAISSGM